MIDLKEELENSTNLPKELLRSDIGNSLIQQYISFKFFIIRCLKNIT